MDIEGAEFPVLRRMVEEWVASVDGSKGGVAPVIPYQLSVELHKYVV